MPVAHRTDEDSSRLPLILLRVVLHVLANLGNGGVADLAELDFHNYEIIVLIPINEVNSTIAEESVARTIWCFPNTVDVEAR